MLTARGSAPRSAPAPVSPCFRAGLRLRPARPCRPAPRPLTAVVHAAAAGQPSQSLLGAAEARLSQFIAELSGEAAGTVTALHQCLVRLLLLLQRVVRWVQLAAVVLHLQDQQQQRGEQQQRWAPGGDDARADNDAAAAPPAPQQQPAAAVMGFISAATTGAVEQLRHTLTDATQGLEQKMAALEATASSMQGTLFQAAQAHSEAVRSNPEGGMWKQACVHSVLSEEERLRQAVFAQVYAELLLKDNKDLGFNASGRP